MFRQQSLELELGLPVGVDGRPRRILGNRHLTRGSVHGARGREDHAAHARPHGGIEQHPAGRDVVREVLLRLRHRFRDEGKSGQMHQSLDHVTGEQLVQHRPIPDPAVHELRSGIDRRAVPPAQVVQHHHRVAAGEELLHHDAPDVARPPRDEDLIRHHAVPTRRAASGPRADRTRGPRAPPP